MSELRDQLEQIITAIEELRAHGTDGPQTRQLLDSLFRRVHSLKAAAAADGLNDLSRAANEVENVLHSLRTGKASLGDRTLHELTETSAALITDLIPAEILNSLKAEERHSLAQSLKEGAHLFLIETSFDVADFDQKFQKLKTRLTGIGEVISIAPRLDNERGGKINFRIVFASQTSKLQIDTPGVVVVELLKQRIESLGEALKRTVQAGKAVAAALGKEVNFEVHGADLSLEPSLCKAIANPLLHLIRNAVDHGIEDREERAKLGKPTRGTIVIEVGVDEDRATIRVTDDGRGIDSEVVKLIFKAGFSTAREVSEISGRGVGLDAVRSEVEAAGGSVTVVSKPGQNTTFEISIPRLS